jgi:hypothetical protein
MDLLSVLQMAGKRIHPPPRRTFHVAASDETLAKKMGNVAQGTSMLLHLCRYFFRQGCLETPQSNGQNPVGLLKTLNESQVERFGPIRRRV